jgi:hypothetical protein
MFIESTITVIVIVLGSLLFSGIINLFKDGQK